MTDFFQSIDWSKALQAVGPILVAAATLARQLRGTSRLHAHLASEVEILSKLPPNSGLYASMSRIVQRRIDALETFNTAKRDWGMLAVSLVAAPGLTYLTIWLVQRDEWWGWIIAAPVGFLAAIFIYGVYETGTPAIRDDKGKRIP